MRKVQISSAQRVHHKPALGTKWGNELTFKRVSRIALSVYSHTQTDRWAAADTPLKSREENMRSCRGGVMTWSGHTDQSDAADQWAGLQRPLLVHDEQKAVQIKRISSPPRLWPLIRKKKKKERNHARFYRIYVLWLFILKKWFVYIDNWVKVRCSV